MASCGGAGDDGGRSPPAAVYDDLVEVREHAATLHSMLQGGGVEASSEAGGRGPGGRRKRSGTVSGPHRRSTSRRRSKSPFINMVTARRSTMARHGGTNRAIANLHLHNGAFRSYYRCSHKPDQGCQATRQVQESDSNPSEYLISYYGQHTCKDSSTFRSLIIQGAADAAPPEDLPNLISFTSINGAAAASTSSSPNHLVRDAADLHSMLFSRFSNYSSSPPVQEGVSSSSPSPSFHGEFTQYAGGQLVDVIGRRTSPLTVGSAPAEYWPVGIAGVDTDAGAGWTASLPRRAASGSCQARSGDHLAITFATTTCSASIPDPLTRACNLHAWGSTSNILL
ncbi:hypothetical protein ZWY2020_051296 [Hordeum vulgare]|nr:hypothetical protein ZWY2020_051296 [Hordeum vulgare]